MTAALSSPGIAARGSSRGRQGPASAGAFPDRITPTPTAPKRRTTAGGENAQSPERSRQKPPKSSPGFDASNPTICRHSTLRDYVKSLSGASEFCGRVRKVVDMTIYTLRNMVGRCFNKLKNSRRLATRYDKTADSFLGFIDIACIRLSLRHLSTHPGQFFPAAPSGRYANCHGPEALHPLGSPAKGRKPAVPVLHEDCFRWQPDSLSVPSERQPPDRHRWRSWAPMSAADPCCNRRWHGSDAWRLGSGYFAHPVPTGQCSLIRHRELEAVNLITVARQLPENSAGAVTSGSRRCRWGCHRRSSRHG